MKRVKQKGFLIFSSDFPGVSARVTLNFPYFYDIVL